MNSKKRVAYATGSRADYGIVRRYLSLLSQQENVELEILTTGSLLEQEYGHQVDLIYNDGFTVGAEIPLDLDSRSNATILESMAKALEKFGKLFAEKKYDLLIVLGDRYEILSVVIAAAMQKIPILHLHGGEATFANYDEFIRHSITKMSTYHFAVTEEYKKRIIQLGEMPERIYNLGALGAENCCFIEEANVDESVKKLVPKTYFVVLFHPETLTDIDVLEQTNELLNAIMHFKEYSFVFIGANADTSSEKIRARVKEFVFQTDNALYYENLHTDAYHYLLKNAICLVGNSSSGIIEAPSLGVYTVNIGDRQKGRVRGSSVLDVPCASDEIVNTIQKVLAQYDKVEPQNPYYQENSAENYCRCTMEILEHLEEDIKEPKQFYDIM